jgi:hypothetical protein
MRGFSRSRADRRAGASRSAAKVERQALAGRRRQAIGGALVASARKVHGIQLEAGHFPLPGRPHEAAPRPVTEARSVARRAGGRAIRRPAGVATACGNPQAGRTGQIGYPATRSTRAGAARAAGPGAAAGRTPSARSATRRTAAACTGSTAGTSAAAGTRASTCTGATSAAGTTSASATTGAASASTSSGTTGATAASTSSGTTGATSASTSSGTTGATSACATSGTASVATRVAAAAIALALIRCDGGQRHRGKCRAITGALDDRPRVCSHAEAERKGSDRKADQDGP